MILEILEFLRVGKSHRFGLVIFGYEGEKRTWLAYNGSLLTNLGYLFSQDQWSTDSKAYLILRVYQHRDYFYHSLRGYHFDKVWPIGEIPEEAVNFAKTGIII